MSYQVLARKYRPQKFSEVIGQDHVTRTLKNAIEQQRIAHGYIFSGHRGIGKTTIARILAMALNCQSQDHPVPEPCGVCDSCREIRAGNAVDVIEIDAATNRGIDEIRELREAARYRPARDRYKIYILDEAHQITDAAFNALLKTLEEPPGHIDLHDGDHAARGHSADHPFALPAFQLSCRALRRHRAAVARYRQAGRHQGRRQRAGDAGRGRRRLNARRAQHHGPGHCLLRHDAERRRSCGDWWARCLRRIWKTSWTRCARNSSEDVLRTVDRLLVEGQSAQHFARQMVRFLRNALVAKVAGADSPVLQISSDERARVARVAERFSEEDLTRFLQIMLRTHGDLGYKQEQRFHLELGLLKLVHAQRLLPLEELLSGEAAQAGSGAGPPGRVAGAGGSDRQLRHGAPRRRDDAAASRATSSRAPSASPFSRAFAV